MSAPEREPQATDFEAVTAEMDTEGTPFVPAVTPEPEQDPPSEGPAAEPAAEPEPKPEPDAAVPEPETEPSPEGEPVISAEAQVLIDAAEARAAAADRAAGLERRQREDFAARQAGIEDRDARMAYAKRLRKALDDPEEANLLLEEQVAAAEANVPVPEAAELGIRNDERQRFGSMMMEQLRDKLGLSGLTQEQTDAAYVAAQGTSGKDVPYAQDVLAAEVKIASGAIADQSARIKELEEQVVANGGEVAGARLRGGAGPETPSEPVGGGRKFSNAQIEDMTEAQWDANEDSIMAEEAKRLERLKRDAPA
jgi:hypothetical protein